jgi:hypothetical protein
MLEVEEAKEKACTSCTEVWPITEYRVKKSGSCCGVCHSCEKERYRVSNAKRNKRRKQKTHKLTAKQVEFITSLKGQYSTRRAASIFAETFFAHTINASTVSRIWNGKLHESQTNPSKGVPCEVCKELITSTFAKKSGRCDGCASLLQRTRINARARIDRTKTLLNVVKHVQADPELEPLDLPFYYRKNIEAAGIKVEDLYHDKAAYSGEGKDWTQDNENIAGAVYAIEFTHDPEYANKVYIGCTKQGVLKRWRQHIADQRADQTKRPSHVGSVEYRNLIRHLSTTNQIHTVRLHILETVDRRHLKYKDKEKEVKEIVESIEQNIQLKLFLGGYDLMNASFRIPCDNLSEVREYMAENVGKDIRVEDISLGYFAGRLSADVVRWEFNPLLNDVV